MKNKVFRNRFSYVSRLSAVFLLIILLSQPVSPIFASEIGTEPPAPVSDSGTSDVTTDATTSDIPTQETNEAVVEPTDIPTEENTSELGDIESGDSLNVADTPSTIPGTEGVDTSEASGNSDTQGDVDDVTLPIVEDEPQAPIDTEITEEVVGVPEQATTNEDVPTDTASTTDNELPAITEEPIVTEEVVESLDDSTSTPETILPTEELSTTTPAETVAGIPPPSETIFYGVATNDSNRFSFSVDECVPMGSETFFCSKQSNQSTSGEVSGVVSMQSSQGNKEIYIVTDATNVQVTDNLYDDEAPYYDTVSNSIVWHRSIDGRYQIVELDMDTNEERIITNQDYNNMYPSRYGDATVWQGWVGENWEIFLDESGDTEMITENANQDISPRVNDNYVIWQAFEDGVWKVKVYDRVSKHTETVANADGTSAQNPRFVLVYDAKHENGDVETRGYDLAERTNVPLSAMPASLPKDLPAPEQTGEARALVSQTPQVKNKLEASSDNNNDPNSNASSTDSTPTDENVLIIPPYATSTVAELPTEELPTDVSSTTDEILIQEEVLSTTTPDEALDVVPTELEQFDIIIPPFDPSILETILEQESI